MSGDSSHAFGRGAQDRKHATAPNCFPDVRYWHSENLRALGSQGVLRLPRFDGHELGLNKGLNHDEAERCRGHTAAI